MEDVVSEGERGNHQDTSQELGAPEGYQGEVRAIG